MNQAMIIFDLQGKVWNILYGVQEPPDGLPYTIIEVDNAVEVVGVDIEASELILNDAEGEEIRQEAELTIPPKSGMLLGAGPVNVSAPEYNQSSLFYNDEYGVCMKIPSAGYYSENTYLYSSESNFGNATKYDVLEGRTVTSKAGFRKEGTIPVKRGITQSGIAGLSPLDRKFFMSLPSRGYYDAASKISCGYDELMKIIGITPDMVRNDGSYLDYNGTSHYADTYSDNDGLMFEGLLSFTDETWEYENEGDRSAIAVIGNRLDSFSEEENTRYVFLQLGIKIDGRFDSSPVFLPVGAYYNQVIALPISNSADCPCVNLVFTKNESGGVSIKGIKGNAEGEYELSIRKLFSTDVPCFWHDKSNV